MPATPASRENHLCVPCWGLDAGGGTAGHTCWAFIFLTRSEVVATGISGSSASASSQAVPCPALGRSAELPDALLRRGCRSPDLSSRGAGQRSCPPQHRWQGATRVLRRPPFPSTDQSERDTFPRQPEACTDSRGGLSPGAWGQWRGGPTLRPGEHSVIVLSCPAHGLKMCFELLIKSRH